jgi:hypothetical protein
MDVSFAAIGHSKSKLGDACGFMTYAATGLPRCALDICKSWSCYIPAFAWLILITMLSSASFFSDNIPFDQRTGQPFAGAALVMPIWGSAIEPVTAVFHMILGAPNYQIAIVSGVCWLFAGSATVAFIAQRNQDQKSRYVKLFRILTFAWGSVIWFIWYLGFALLVPLPSWSLVLKDPGAIVADLHSHTVASHDAIASEQQNLSIHRDRGYGVVAWAEHYPAPWQSIISAADRAKGASPTVIPGMEISISIDDRNYHLLVLQFGTEVPIETWLPKLIDDQALRNFSAMVHAAHGVVVAVNFKLNEKDIDRLVAAGVDAFEIANLGHPWVSSALHTAMIKAQNSHGISLIANSDWHGWGGFFRTWTVVTSTDPNRNPAAEIVDALWRHDADRIVPVVSQVFYTPSILRSIFSPFTEAVRYGSGLQPLQLGSWWIWTLSLIWLAGRTRRAGLNPARIFLTVISLILGLGIMFRGLNLVMMSYHGLPYVFPLKVGLAGCALGISALFGAWWMARNRTRPILAEPDQTPA